VESLQVYAVAGGGDGGEGAEFGGVGEEVDYRAGCAGDGGCGCEGGCRGSCACCLWMLAEVGKGRGWGWGVLLLLCSS
jgi:hypothetical protein